VNEPRPDIQQIQQPDDPRIADYAHVGDPAWLRLNGLFVAEGRIVVGRLLTAPRFRIRSILVTPPVVEALGPLPTSVVVHVAKQPVVTSITGFNFHRGCLALVERPPDSAVEEVVRGNRVLVLEGVGNPDNVGGLFRVAAAFGVSGVLLDPTSGDPFYRKAVRTSMASALMVPQARLRPWPDALAIVREHGFTIVALTPSGSTSVQEIAAVNFRKIALLVGAEGTGLTEEALAAADVAARIPMPGGIDSLNVTVAAGIALSHLA
jgi:tRNA G18 (ribose-2'-O)-methylase SpoU